MWFENWSLDLVMRLVVIYIGILLIGVGESLIRIDLRENRRIKLVNSEYNIIILRNFVLKKKWNGIL